MLRLTPRLTLILGWNTHNKLETDETCRNKMLLKWHVNLGYWRWKLSFEEICVDLKFLSWKWNTRLRHTLFTNKLNKPTLQQKKVILLVYQECSQGKAFSFLLVNILFKSKIFNQKTIFCQYAEISVITSSSLKNRSCDLWVG